MNRADYRAKARNKNNVKLYTMYIVDAEEKNKLPYSALARIIDLKIVNRDDGWEPQLVLVMAHRKFHLLEMDKIIKSW